MLTGSEMRQLERETIRAFLAGHAPELHGDVLDFGCGLQPYRDLVEAAGATYHGWDRAAMPGNVSGSDIGDLLPVYDAIISTQISQYLPSFYHSLRSLRDLLHPGGLLLMTGPAVWPELEAADHLRHTRTGVAALLRAAGFSDALIEPRGLIPGFTDDFRLFLGWQAQAWA